MAIIHFIGTGYSPLGAALQAGGKAHGLSTLVRSGANVPLAFVIVGAATTNDIEGLDDAYEAIGGGKVAVRSSAIGEDGLEASFAGQFDTILNVVGTAAINEAIQLCLKGRAEAYAADRTSPSGEMAVVVQAMIEPVYAGVIFTADPTTHRRDRIVVDAVAGLGEQLVSGTVQPDHFLTDLSGAIVDRQLSAQPTMIDDSLVRQLAIEAVGLALAFEQSLDLEWATDAEGAVWWLQARPVTTLGADPNERDIPAAKSDIITRCNIGEIMPGAVTPLTQSTTGRGIDRGMQAMMVAAGAARRIEPDILAINSYFGHLFINLSIVARISGAVLGSDVQQIGMSICGRPVPELKATGVQSLPRRLRNAFTYFRYITGAEKRLREFQARGLGFSIEAGGTAADTYASITTALPMLDETYDVHMQASAGSGAATGALHRIFARDRAPNTSDYTRIARLFASLGELEGADLIAGLREVAAAIDAHPEHLLQFNKATPDESLAWLQNEQSGEAGVVFRQFLADHGHRCFRELEMHQQGWRDNPLPLVDSFRLSLSAGQPPERAEKAADASDSETFVVRLLVDQARGAVQRREKTKAILVHVTNQFKVAYRSLADQLVADGLLPEKDLIFFLLHDEIAALLNNDLSMATRARARQKVFPVQSAFRFPDIFAGKPEPLGVTPPNETGGRIIGNPVSAGIVEGRACVAHTPADAANLQEGDILIAPITDIGWTPYFRLISGLATDIGSSVSHGAVIAREYGLPALVNTGNGTQAIKSGDIIRLDAIDGYIEILR